MKQGKPYRTGQPNIPSGIYRTCTTHDTHTEHINTNYKKDTKGMDEWAYRVAAQERRVELTWGTQ